MTTTDNKTRTDSRTDYGYASDSSIHTVQYLAGPLVKSLQLVGAKRILDMGCGNGSITRILYTKGFQIVGMDTSATGIAHCQSLMPEAMFLKASVYDDPAVIGPEPFDAVVASEVIEHLYSPAGLLRFAAKVLSPRGRLILTPPYHGYWKNLALSITDKWDSHWMPLREGGHIKFWSVSTMSRLLDNEGFEVTKIVGCGRLPLFWKSMLIVARKRSDG